MIQTKRVATVSVAAVLAMGSVSVPAMGTTSSHWTKSQCVSYVKAFKKKHAHPSSSQLKAANKTLKSKGCTEQA